MRWLREDVEIPRWLILVSVAAVFVKSVENGDWLLVAAIVLGFVIGSAQAWHDGRRRVPQP